MLNGVHFRKGALVALLFATVHYDPNVWTDPEVFNPDRYCQSVVLTLQMYLLHVYYYLCPIFKQYQVILFFVHLQIHS